jgi:hypothetical protein
LHHLYDELGAVQVLPALEQPRCPAGEGTESLCFGCVCVRVQQGVDIFEQRQVVQAHFSVAPSENASLLRQDTVAATDDDSHMGQLLSCFSALAHAV